MARRKGLGKGKGMGYKNMIPKDPKVHSQSAKGMKQPQRIPANIKAFIQANKDLVKKELNNKLTLDNIEFNDDATEVVRTPTGMVRVFPDDDPQDPREWDNLGRMFCSHGRYDLGDKHPEKSDDFGDWNEIEEYLIKEKKAILLLPLYLYDHSGLRMKIGSFQGYLPQGHAEFDSGMVGFIYVTKEDIKNQFGDKKWRNKYHKGKSDIEIAKTILEGEVNTYDQYISGDVWRFEAYDNSGEMVEAVSGFFGIDEAIEEGKSVLPKQ